MLLIVLVANAAPTETVPAPAPAANATEAASVLALTVDASLAVRAMLPLVTVVATDCASMKASTRLVVVLEAVPPAPAAAAPAAAPTPIDTAPPAEMASIKDVSVAVSVRLPPVASTVEALMYACTVLVMMLVAVAAPTAPATPAAPTPTAPATPPPLAITVATSVAVSEMPPLALTPLLLPLATLLLSVMKACTRLARVFLESAPAPATATPTVPPPTATAPPRLKDRMVALSLASTLMLPAERTSDAATPAVMMLAMLFTEAATPRATPTPVVPPMPAARLVPPASERMMEVSLAVSDMLPLVSVLTTLLLRITAVTVFAIVLPAPAPAAPTPTPAPPPPAADKAPPMDSASTVASDSALSVSRPPFTLTMESSM